VGDSMIALGDKNKSRKWIMPNKGKDVEEKKNPCVSMWTRRNMISLITLEREWEAIKCYGMILLAIFATKGTSQFG